MLKPVRGQAECLRLAFQTHSWQLDAMNKAALQNTNRSQETQTFPAMRKSHSAQQSFAAELDRLHAMSIEERVLEALGMSRRFSGIIPARKER